MSTTVTRATGWPVVLRSALSDAVAVIGTAGRLIARHWPALVALCHAAGRRPLRFAAEHALGGEAMTPAAAESRRNGIPSTRPISLCDRTG